MQQDIRDLQHTTNTIVSTAKEEFTASINHNSEQLLKSAEQLKGSWADVARITAPSSSSTVNSTEGWRQVFRESLNEQQKKDYRKLNVVAFSFPEGKDVNDDLQSFHSLCDQVLGCKVEIQYCRRLGQRSATTTRPLLIRCNSEVEKRKLLLSAKHLKDASDPNVQKIFIAQDMSKEERLVQKKLRAKKKERESNGETNLIIRSGRIIVKNW
jgi:hypothetical protein